MLSISKTTSLRFLPKYYAKSHEFVDVKDNIAKVGISVKAAHDLGDIVFVEIPEVGTEIAAGEVFSTIESVKAASDIYSPVSGVITVVNEDLDDSPALVNEDAEGKGWIAIIELSDPSEVDSMMDLEAYKVHCENEH